MKQRSKQRVLPLRFPFWWRHFFFFFLIALAQFLQQFEREKKLQTFPEICRTVSFKNERRTRHVHGRKKSLNMFDKMNLKSTILTETWCSHQIYKHESFRSWLILEWSSATSAQFTDSYEAVKRFIQSAPASKLSIFAREVWKRKKKRLTHLILFTAPVIVNQRRHPLQQSFRTPRFPLVFTTQRSAVAL